MTDKTKRDLILLAGLLWLLWPKTTVTTSYSYGGEVGGTNPQTPEPPVQILPLPGAPPTEPGAYDGQIRSIDATIYVWDASQGTWLGPVAQGTTYYASGGPADAAGGSSDYLPYATL